VVTLGINHINALLINEQKDDFKDKTEGEAKVVGDKSVNVGVHKIVDRLEIVIKHVSTEERTEVRGVVDNRTEEETTHPTEEVTIDTSLAANQEGAATNPETRAEDVVTREKENTRTRTKGVPEKEDTLTITKETSRVNQKIDGKIWNYQL